MTWCWPLQFRKRSAPRGAKAVAFTVRPDIALAVDATTAADTAGVPAEKQVCRVFGGPVVSFMDRSTLYDQALYERIRETAKEIGVKSQTKTVIAGGNDASSLQRAAGGAGWRRYPFPAGISILLPVCWRRKISPIRWLC